MNYDKAVDNSVFFIFLKKNILEKIVLLILVTIISTPVYAGKQKPSKNNEPISGETKDVLSKNRFKNKVNLPDKVIEKLRLNSDKLSRGEKEYIGRIENRNKHWYINSIVLRIFDHKTNDYNDYTIPVNTTYYSQISFTNEQNPMHPEKVEPYSITPSTIPKYYSLSIVSGDGYYLPYE